MTRKIAGIATLSLLIILIISIIFSLYTNFSIKTTLKYPLYFLAIGVDSEESGVSRTDTLILVSIDEKGKTLLTPIPRDLIIKINNEERKINSVYEHFGIERLFDEIENISGIRPQKYVIFNYSIFKEIGDIISPVKIFVEKDMFYQDYHQNLNINFKRGYNNLNGSELLSYVRFRHDEYGDIGRIERQKQALFAMLKTAQERGFFTLLELVKTVNEKTTNTFEIYEMLNLYGKLKSSNLTFMQLPIKLEGNYVLIDEHNIDEFKYKISKFKDPEENEKQLWLLFTKNYENNAYSFYTYIFNNWKEKGYQIKILDKKIDFQIENKVSYIFSKNNQKIEKIKEDLEKHYEKEFKIINNDEYYLELIKFFSDNLIDTTPYDALVIMNE
ncbi:LCP family protein [Oceanotoga sp. DSM 15011]|uniref:LytR family transcriptional attenuator n=1 Tax=Oceanotoga teriensis TaxID=515440 RepID=A0AA45C9G1_9BACT|nr:MULTISPECIES: LCP family protein [Oceanotoga]MDN5342903.1 polyisoprenyl-teichoic acid--peptidoglycan teichoic acid transferase [Oceanotoga sp.]MDO7975379.1 LCP family protein [Oceanotoga teriensis]PWJ96711.1 LytR family transcriptional attenuator [Oceanotoga teriensis]UYP00117.1 LCP family protein [Oceanotoga sp. DSM 15011]